MTYKKFFIGLLKPAAWIGIRAAAVYYSTHKDPRIRAVGISLRDSQHSLISIKGTF